ncbi:MAG TPA: phosphotransferase [Oculatellaceae cyanobacterium]
MTPQEDESLNLLVPPPDEKLAGWLREFYGKPTEIVKRQLLRHRDLSYVERLTIADALPESLIYKLVLPPWEIEQDLHERVLIPSITNSAQLYLSGHYGPQTALFLEDVGTVSLLDAPDEELGSRIGEDLAKMHRSYCYRTDELMQMGILRTLSPVDYGQFTNDLTAELTQWSLIDDAKRENLSALAQTLAGKLAGEPTSLVHGDLYAENIILRNNKFYIIDWSWFTILGVPIMDLATLTMKHPKNGAFHAFAEQVIESYCFESGRDSHDVRKLLPAATTLGRLLFLYWLVERRRRGILGTTVGPVDELIPKIVNELINLHAKL